MSNKREVGSRFEIVAKNFLVNMGYSIICMNFFAKFGEIDIIAKDDKYLCFIEVKYRDKDGLIKGFMAVDKKKQRHIYMTAKYYLYKNKINENDTLCRFDIVSIDGNDITLIKNAF